ncbi:hypothetical protein [Parasitella parasitica]|uniref:Uncharacterized protein n=1 Tax=Parasitella parasitica TaxID=35722 RepID=A0A0B7N8P8_9FUNG|nr:hypothetical protein [Parasitella parasitica]
MSGSTDDESYMNMINNPNINPGPSTMKPLQKANIDPKPCVFPAVEEAKRLLTRASKDVYLSSETDEGFEWINTETNQEHLPTTEEELVQFGLINEQDLTGSLAILSMQEFLSEGRYKDIVAAFQTIQKEAEDSKAYLVGERSVTVLLLCIVQDKQSSKKAIVGLKSLQVQT